MKTTIIVTTIFSASIITLSILSFKILNIVRKTKDKLIDCLIDPKYILPTKKRKTKAISKSTFRIKQFKRKTLNDYRVKAGLAQSALAKKTGISAPQISRLETGSIEMTWEYAAKLAKVFKIDKFDLMQ